MLDDIPDVDLLLSLPPEELATTLLRFAKRNEQNGMFRAEGPWTTREYPRHREAEVEVAEAEAWQWLWINLLIVPAKGIAGHTGWMRLSRRGKSLVDNPEGLQRFIEAARFPKDLLHPSIADKVWLALARGELDEAVFAAFKVVEVSVRKAAGLGATEIGVPLMRKAFDEATGPLRDKNQLPPEREALAHLFAGAIGSYKNPHSHRTVSLTDAREAQEMVLLASHLLRIVEARHPSRRRRATRRSKH